MNAPYAPTTSDFREVWAGFNGYGGLVARPHSVTTDEGYAEFDRWMAKVKAGAKREGMRQGWEEAVEKAADCGWMHVDAVADVSDRNPYRGGDQ